MFTAFTTREGLWKGKKTAQRERERGGKKRDREADGNRENRWQGVTERHGDLGAGDRQSPDPERDTRGGVSGAVGEALREKGTERFPLLVGVGGTSANLHSREVSKMFISEPPEMGNKGSTVQKGKITAWGPLTEIRHPRRGRRSVQPGSRPGPCCSPS